MSVANECALGTARTTSVPDLTPAEMRLLPLLCTGYSNKEISSVLGRAESTIKKQIASTLRKFRVPSRARLVAALAAQERPARSTPSPYLAVTWC